MSWLTLMCLLFRRVIIVEVNDTYLVNDCNRSEVDTCHIAYTYLFVCFFVACNPIKLISIN